MNQESPPPGTGTDRPICDERPSSSSPSLPPSALNEKGNPPLAVNLSAACQRAAHAMPGGRRKKKMGEELRGRRIYFYCFPASKIPVYILCRRRLSTVHFSLPHTSPGQHQIIDSEFPGQPRSVGPPPLRPARNSAYFLVTLADRR